MKVRGDIESVNLSTGEQMRRVTGEGESTLENMPMLVRDDLSDSKAVHKKIVEYQKNNSMAALGYIAKRLLDERDKLQSATERLPCGHWKGDWVADVDGMLVDGVRAKDAVGYCRTCAEILERTAAAMVAQREADAKLFDDRKYNVAAASTIRNSPLASASTQKWLTHQLAVARTKLMQDMHDDLQNCLQEGKDPVLLLVVWRDIIATEAEAQARDKHSP